MGWLSGAVLEKVISKSIGSSKLPWWFFILILSIDICDVMQLQGGKYPNLNIIRFHQVHSIKTPQKSLKIIFLNLFSF